VERNVSGNCQSGEATSAILASFPQPTVNYVPGVDCPPPAAYPERSLPADPSSVGSRSSGLSSEVWDGPSLGFSRRLDLLDFSFISLSCSFEDPMPSSSLMCGCLDVTSTGIVGRPDDEGRDCDHARWYLPVPGSILGIGLAFGLPFARLRAWRDRRQTQVETADQPYYTELESVYHVVGDCPLGRRIPAELRRDGTGGRSVCPACEVRLEARGRDLS
jgi:hypothetical protein